MPDRGILERSQITAPELGPTRPWDLRGVRVAQVTFEVAKESAVEVLPGEVTRPIPCYARLLVIDAPSTPVGPLKAALLFAGGRYRLMARNVLVEAVIEGDAEAVGAAFGGSVRRGSVALVREGSRVEAIVGDPAGALARIELPALTAIDASMLRWDPWLTFGRAGGDLNLVEVVPTVTPEVAYLSKGATFEPASSLARAHTWRRLRNLKTISATYVEGDLAFAAPVIAETLR